MGSTQITSIPTSKPNGASTGPLPAVNEGVASWTPERVFEAALAAGSKASPGGSTRDPIARIMCVTIVGVLVAAYISHEDKARSFMDAMDANKEATYIMIDVICEAHPEAAMKCKTAERKLRK